MKSLTELTTQELLKISCEIQLELLKRLWWVLIIAVVLYVVLVTIYYIYNEKKWEKKWGNKL